MRTYKGSFTIEAAYILPLILFCFCIVAEVGVTLHEEVKTQVEVYRKNEPLDIIKGMYRREYLKELFGE